MEKKFIGNVPIEEIERQCNADVLKCDSNSPLDPGYVTLEPAIRGAKKVLADPELREIFKKMYMGR